MINGLKLINMKKNRQYRSNQGRSPKQQSTNEKMAFWSILGLAICLIYLLITN